MPFTLVFAFQSLLCRLHRVQDLGGLRSNLGGVEVHLRVGRLHTSLDAEHVSEGVLVAVLDLEATPHLPEFLLLPRIAKLRGVGVDAARTIHLAEHRLHFSILRTSIFNSLLWQIFNGLFVDFTCACLAKKFRRFSKEDGVHVVHVLLLHSFCRPVVDGQCMPCEAMLFLQLCVEHVQAARELCRNLFKSLLKQIACSLELPATVSFNKTREIRKPNVHDVRPLEGLDAALIDFERLLKIFPLLQDPSVAQNQRWCGHFVFESCVVRRTG
mmetsp:Transcript_53713/g.143683  ORF Transcript_53713/g.143683 Transcript_53713/m.143683 type:complete len:270 (+) Transcript_53713:586-1395(+)